MKLGTGSVSGVVPYDTHPEAFGILLDRMPDVSDPVAFHGILDAFEEALSGDIDELLILSAYRSDRICARCIAVVAFACGAHIHAYDIAFLEYS